MVEEAAPKRDRPRWNTLSVTIFVVGLLILIPSGLFAFIEAIVSYLRAGLSAVWLVLGIGIWPVALGAGLVYAGLKSRQRE